VVATEQLTTRVVPAPSGETAERAARETLRAQVARLEHELSGIVARCFPHISPLPAAVGECVDRPAPRILSLGELEQLRDRLVVRVREAQRQVALWDVHERRAREQLERMRAQPRSYKFARLPVTDLGERGCGVWEVRPRLGLLGMLAGWWELRLSSGCPLAGPRAHSARLPPDTATRPPAPVGGAAPGRGRARRRAGATARRPARPRRSSADGERRLLGAGCREGLALALGQRPHGLGLGHAQRDEQLAAADPSPSVLAQQQVDDRHVADLPRALADHLGDVELADGDSPLELGAS
jgi:hypothetical protein